MRRVRRDEWGVTMVEAAFVIPILFVFIFGLIDFGLWTLQKGQATSAARDGARAGIVLPLKNANSATDTANKNKVVAAIQARLPAGQVSASGVTMTCLSGSTGTTKDCDDAQYGFDRIRVEVDWQRPFLTFVGSAFGSASTITGTSTMVIVGQPDEG